MKIAPIEFTMKDGRIAVLCSPKPEDAEEMIRYMALSTAETDFLMRYPEEAQEYTVESEREFLESRNDSDTDAMITCYVDGRIAGNCASRSRWMILEVAILPCICSRRYLLTASSWIYIS